MVASTHYNSNNNSNVNTSRQFDSMNMLRSTNESPNQTLKNLKMKAKKGDKENQSEYYVGKKTYLKPPTPGMFSSKN